MVGKTILIVDENPASRLYLAKLLRGKQFNVLEAPTGRKGLIIAWRDQPDLVLFDPTFHDIPDEGFIQKLRSDPRTGKSLLIALSDAPGPARRETCLKAGVDDYLVKSSQVIPALEQSLGRALSLPIWSYRLARLARLLEIATNSIWQPWQTFPADRRTQNTFIRVCPE